MLEPREEDLETGLGGGLKFFKIGSLESTPRGAEKELNMKK